MQLTVKMGSVDYKLSLPVDDYKYARKFISDVISRNLDLSNEVGTITVEYSTKQPND